MSSPRYPAYGQAWGACGTCGFVLPVRWLTQTRKHGWQCLPGSGRTRGCFDGNMDRDDINYAYPAGEGARTTAAPLTRTLTDGVDVYDTYDMYTLRDRADGTLWDLTFPVAPDDLLTFTPSVSGNLPSGGIYLNNGWVLYVQNTFLYFSEGFLATIPDAADWNGAGDFRVDAAGFLMYTPYVQALVNAGA